MFHRSDDAVAGTVAFIVAGALFLVIIGAVVLVSLDIGQDTRDADHAAGRLGAESLADLLVSSQGVGWAAGADDLTRLGLLAQNGSGLDAGSLQLMRGGTFDATANGLLDYDEARTSLGLSDTEDFHVRIYPPALADILGIADLSHIQLAYIGDWVDAPSGTLTSLDPDVVAADAQTEADQTANIVTSSERDSIVSLGTAFDDLVFLDYSGFNLVVDLPILPDVPLVDFLNDTLLDGDVFPDDKQFLDATLPNVLDRYDLLIVGSQVDQNTLTGNAVKSKIEDWVLSGGTLVVLGSDDQSFQWLQPIFSVGTATVNGGAFAPDINHPVLTVPNELAWTEYDDHGLGWDIKDQGSGAHYDDFTHVILEDGEDLLAISNDGAFGAGRIFLTTFRPGEIADALGIQEAFGLMQNIVLFDDRSDLYLDYGPTVPTDQAVSTAVRLSHLWDNDAGQVPVRVEVLYWSA